ncbi:MAG: hypothetical protein E6G97_23620 [Alphaproteobacteria bacterium]|nr:MAG: hypothetical protein E6G97_23620 [Alphaproteobacteria bacterium]
MAQLNPYFGPHTGTLKIYVGIFRVGQGSFEDFKQFQTSFDGSYNAFGQSGTFDIKLLLSDQNAGAAHGPCAITLNGKTDSAAQYQTDNEKLTITTALNDTPIVIYRSQNGTQVDGISGHNLWIG